MTPDIALALVLVLSNLAGFHEHQGTGSGLSDSGAVVLAFQDAPLPVPARPAPPAPPAPSASEDKIVSDHIRDRLKKSRSLWAQMGVQEINAISKFVKDFEPASYSDRIMNLATGVIPNDPPLDELRNLSAKLVNPSETLNSEFETQYERLLIGAIEKIVAEAQDEAAKSLKPGRGQGGSILGTPVAGSDSAEDPAKLLAANKVIDLFAVSNRNDLAKVKAAQATKFFPGGKARSVGGFDKLTPEKQVEAIRKNTSDYMREIIRSSMKKAGAKASDIELVLSDKGFEAPSYQKNFETMASEIVNSGGKPKLELEPIDGLSEDLRKELQEHLEAKNEKYNQGDDKKVARETKNLRAGRLLDDARGFLKKNDPLGDELSDAKLASVKQYCERIARPEGTAETEEVASSDDIDDYKASIYGKVRELYKELGGFGRILGVFGLKGYFAGIIADALAKRLDRVLTGDERAKVDEWAASLATELHGSEPGQIQQPGNVIRYPVQNPQGYTQMPLMPVVPVMPHGKWNHGAKWGGYRPAGYLVPAAGGYMVVPR